MKHFKDLNKIYQNAFKKVFQTASNWSKEQGKLLTQVL